MGAPGERANVIKRDDNLQPEGEFHKRPDQTWAPGERANIVKRGDNLQPEGDFSKRPDATWAPGERANVIKRHDNLQPEGEFHKRPDQTWAPGLLEKGQMSSSVITTFSFETRILDICMMCKSDQTGLPM